jgi:hypothetical protein
MQATVRVGFMDEVGRRMWAGEWDENFHFILLPSLMHSALLSIMLPSFVLTESS